MGTSGTVRADADDVEIVVSDEIRLLVTGGDGLERDALGEALDKQDDLYVAAAVPRDEVLRSAAGAAPHVAVVLYDDASYLELCRRLSLRRVGLVLADSFASARDFAACRDAGALGFVHRDSPVPTLTQAVRAVASGRQFRDPRIPDEPPDPFGLTERQLEVLALLVERLTNAEIARQLSVSENTVKDHLSNIYEKLDVHSREAARDIAIRDGLVPARENFAR